MGFLAALTGDERYAAWGWRGLRELASAYEAYGETHDSEKTPYRYFYGGLYEAQCQLQVVQALELLADAPGASPDDIERLRAAVITPGCEALDRWMNVMQVHNMTVWAMSALAQAGRMLGRQGWVDRAFGAERNGLRSLLTRGLPRNGATGEPDGFWFEHAPFYACFYVLTAITPLVRAADAAGALDDDGRARYAAMFDAMPHLVDGELRILSVSDRVAPGTMRLTQTRHLFEYAAGQVDARHAPLLALLHERCGAPRGSWAALAFGPDELPAPAPPKTLRQSCVLPEAGLATLRATTSAGNATLWFQNLKRYDGAPQGHHHMDKLSLSLHAFGEVITSDLGWPGCESKQSGRGAYLSGTLSHNTLMLDEYDQGVVETLSFKCDPDADTPWARGSFRGRSTDKMTKVFRDHHGGRLADGVYDDAVITRTVWWDFPRVVVRDELVAGTEKRFDFVFHARGQMVARAMVADGAAPLGMPALPEDGAWQFFSGRADADPVELLIADWRVRSDVYVRLVAVGDGPFDAHWGRTPDNPAEVTRGTVVLRAPGAERRFATVLELHHGTPRAAGVELEADGSVRVAGFEGGESRYVAPSPDEEAS